MNAEDGKKYYDQGWNAYVAKKPFDNTATRDWQDGWKDCYEAPLIHQVEMQ